MAVLFDSDVLIDYLRGHPDAVELIESSISEAYLSAISVAELYQGVRDGDERVKLSATLSAFSILSVTADIAEQAGLFSRKYRSSHGAGLADCLIAATAEAHGLTLQTLNGKHSPMVSKVVVPYRKGGK